MTVGELITLLQTFDPTLPVQYQDFENGPSEVTEVELASVLYARLKITFRDNEYVSLS